MVGEVGIGKKPGIDGRMECLDSSAEHLRMLRQLTDVMTSDTRLAEPPGGTVSCEQVEPKGNEPSGKRNETIFVEGAENGAHNYSTSTKIIPYPLRLNNECRGLSQPGLERAD